MFSSEHLRFDTRIIIQDMSSSGENTRMGSGEDRTHAHPEPNRTRFAFTCSLTTKGIKFIKMNS